MPIIALTLVEVMIAIVVFGIGILAVLQSITSNMSATIHQHHRTQATLLAKEAMELVFHKRDSNVLSGMPRNCLVPLPQDRFTWDEVCEITWQQDMIYLVDRQTFIAKDTTDTRDEQRQQARLSYQDMIPSYHHQTGSGSIFARYITFEPTQHDDLRKVSSHVLIHSGRTGEVVLTSHIGTY